MPRLFKHQVEARQEASEDKEDQALLSRHVHGSAPAHPARGVPSEHPSDGSGLGRPGKLQRADSKPSTTASVSAESSCWTAGLRQVDEDEQLVDEHFVDEQEEQVDEQLVEPSGPAFGSVDMGAELFDQESGKSACLCPKKLLAKNCLP
jgi:hypothetical protein